MRRKLRTLLNHMKINLFEKGKKYLIKDLLAGSNFFEKRRRAVGVV
jgi:hypothetical protein